MDGSHSSNHKRCQLVGDKIGVFLKGLGNNFFCISCQIFGKFLGFLKSITFQVKAVVAAFGHLFVKIWLLFKPTSDHTGRGR